MDPRSQLTLVGISHRTAPVGVRERYVVSAADLEGCLRALLQLEGASEAFVLSTCNRTEALVVGPRGHDLAPLVRAHLFRNVSDELVYAYTDVQALIHFFRVASGLDSVVVGESEVLAQIKRGSDASTAAGALGVVLKPLVQASLHVGKRVRTETELGRGTLSIARVGVDIARRAFGKLDDERALVVGAGETGILVAKHLRDLSIGRLAFTNRTFERAQAAAAELRATAHPLSELRALVADADIVVACVEAQTAAIDASAFDAKTLRRREKPLLVLDLSVPRAVAPEVAQLSKSVLLYDLDDLARVVGENAKGRGEAIEGTTEILVSELHKFLALRTYATFAPAIQALRERFEKVRDECLDRAAGPRADAKQVELAHELSKRLLDVALEQMKDGARRVRSEEALDREYQRFLENLG